LIRLRRRPRLRAVTQFGAQAQLLAVDECEKDNPPKRWRYHGLGPWGSMEDDLFSRLMLNSTTRLLEIKRDTGVQWGLDIIHPPTQETTGLAVGLHKKVGPVLIA
jgi:hypothetical protein